MKNNIKEENRKQFKILHIVHLLIFAPLVNKIKPEPIIGRTRLMKMVFLFEKEILKSFAEGQELNSDFIAFDYGPYSKKVYEAIDFLQVNDIIKVKEINPNRIDAYDLNIETVISNFEENSDVLEADGDDQLLEGFWITEKGIQMMNNKDVWFSWINLNENQKKMLQEFKNRSVTARLYDILKYVYHKYPDYAENSKIKELFLVK